MVNVAILGFGVVGCGVAEILTQNKKIIEDRVGESINIKYILDLRDFPDSPFGHLVIHDFNTILNDSEVSLVVEMMGGSHPAYDFSKAALEAGKSVVTSNKEVVANFGVELLQIAHKMGVSYMFEASVGGGIPIIRPMRSDLSPNNVISINGILNGTTNYILTQMDVCGADFAVALKEAQAKGYAEANPDADIKGIDAARKIVILAAMAYGKMLDSKQIYTDGICEITPELISLAKEFGCAVKLIATAKELDGKILAFVAPRFVPVSNPLHSISDVFNGILINSDMLGESMFYGKGAGRYPTASAVVSDVVEIAKAPCANMPSWTLATEDDIASLDDYSCRSCFVFEANEADALITTFGGAEQVIMTDGKVAFIGTEMTERECEAKLASLDAKLVSRTRVI